MTYSLVAQLVKNLPAVQETWVRSLGWEGSLEKEWQPTPVSLPGKSHGQRSLVGCSPWGRKEADTTEHLTRWVRCPTDSQSLFPATGLLPFLSNAISNPFSLQGSLPSGVLTA